MQNKHVGPFLAFNEEWFARHQRKLLTILNDPILRRWGRWVLRISRSECAPEKDIQYIGPNRFTVIAGERLRTTFRTHPKYAKRIYHAFRPGWWALHGWDSLLPARVARARELSFGFDTLTVYPDPDPESTSVDGEARRTVAAFGEDFPTIRAGAGTASSDLATTSRAWLQADTYVEPNFTSLARGFFLFDTSALPDNATITSAVLSLWVSDKLSDLGQTSLEIVASTPASNTALVAADYGQIGGTSFASKAYADVSVGSYTDFTLNASGLAAISKTGISKFGTRLGWDRSGSFGGTWASSKQTRFYITTADETGTGADPKLVVTYTVAGGPKLVVVSEQ